MQVGNINFVTWTYLSDAYENICTLLSHTYDYNGKLHSTLEVLYGDGGEYDLTSKDYEMLVEKYPTLSDYKRIEYFYADICEQEGIILLAYEQLEELEKLVNKK